jgi:hypothetical protein
MSGGTFGTNWLDLSSTSNRYTRTYIQGFMDISGGNLIIRQNNLYLTQGDASINGNLILGYDASLNKRLFLGGDASLNSRLFINGDASLNSRLFVGSDASFGGKIFVNGDASFNKRLFLGGGLNIMPTATSTRYTASYLNDNPLFIRGDTAHGVAYGNSYASIFYTGVDGPFLYGYGGGALGSYSSATTNTALSWSNDKSITLNGNTNITGTNVINFGSDQTKQTSAGRIGYGTFSSGESLDIVGAGTSTTTRSVKIYDHLTVDENLTTGGTITSGGAIDAAGAIGVSRSGQCISVYNSGTGDVVSISKVGTSTDYCIMLDNNGSSTTGNFLYFENGGQNVGTIRSTGTSSVSYNTSSDYRLKQNISDITNAEYIIEQLKPVSFEFKSEPGIRVNGFIAHEVQEIIPLCVSGDKDAVDASGNPEYQGIDTGFMISYVIKMLQIQNKKIYDFQEEITNLKQLINNK